MHKLIFTAGILTGAVWLAANFIFTRNLLKIAVLKKPKEKLLLLLLIKFPVLYLLGFLILIVKVFPISSLFLGMTLILLILGASIIWPKRAKSNTNCRI